MGIGDSNDNVLDVQNTTDRLSKLTERSKVQEECWNMVENEGLLKEIVDIATRRSHSSDNLDSALDLLIHIAKNCIIDLNEILTDGKLEKHYPIFHKKMEEAGGYTGLGKLLLLYGQSVEKKKEKEKVAVALACCSLFRSKINSSAVAKPLVSTLVTSLQDCKMDETLRIYNLLCASYSCVLIQDTCVELVSIALDVEKRSGIGAVIHYCQVLTSNEADPMTSLFMKFLDHSDPHIVIISALLVSGMSAVKVVKPTVVKFMELILSNSLNILTCGKSIEPLSVSERVLVSVPTPLSSPLCYVSATVKDTRLSPMSMCAHFLSCVNEIFSRLDTTLLPEVAGAFAERLWDLLLIAFELFYTLHFGIRVGDVHEVVEDDVVVLTNRSRQRLDLNATGLLTTRTIGLLVQLMEKHPPIVPAFQGCITTIVPLVFRQREIAFFLAANTVLSTEEKMSDDESAIKTLETYTAWTDKDLEGNLKRVYISNVAFAAGCLFLVCRHGSKHPDPATGRNSLRGRMDACAGMDVFPVISNFLVTSITGYTDPAVKTLASQGIIWSALAVCLLHRGGWPPLDVFAESVEILRIRKDKEPACAWIWDEMKENPN